MGMTPILRVFCQSFFKLPQFHNVILLKLKLNTLKLYKKLLSATIIHLAKPTIMFSSWAYPFIVIASDK